MNIKDKKLNLLGRIFGQEEVNHFLKQGNFSYDCFEDAEESLRKIIDSKQMIWSTH